jgi:TPR repeat protein
LKDIPEAIEWYTKAAEQGDEEAAERIKVLKQEGEQ